MNHDYAHCADYTSECPKSCFRAQLAMDLKQRTNLLGIPLSWMHLKGTDECMMEPSEELDFVQPHKKIPVNLTVTSIQHCGVDLREVADE